MVQRNQGGSRMSWFLTSDSLMNYIDQLNRKLGESLGYVCAGTLPRYAWKWAPDLPLWRHRLGSVWVLCQWQRPSMTEQAWTGVFDGRYPYPGSGHYQAHAETALAPGLEPTEGLTQNYIWALDRQMSTSLVSQILASQDAVDRDQENNYVEWVERVQDSNPAYSNFAPGARGGHVSYGTEENAC